MRPSMWRSLVGAAIGYSSTKRSQLEEALRGAVNLPVRRADCESGLGKFPLMFILEDHRYPVGSLIAGALSYFKYMGVKNIFFESDSSQTALQKMQGYLDDKDNSFGITKEVFNDVFYAVQARTNIKARANIEDPGFCSYTQEGFLKAIKAVGPEGVEEVFSELHGDKFTDNKRIEELSSLVCSLPGTSEHELLSKSLSFGITKEVLNDVFYAVQARTNIKARANIEDPGFCSYTQEGFLKAIKAVGPEGVEEVFSELHGHKFTDSKKIKIKELSYLIWSLSDMSEHELLSESLKVLGEDGVHNVDMKDSELSVDSLKNPEMFVARNAEILFNILSKANSGIYYGGVAHYGYGQMGIANLLDVARMELDVGTVDPRDTVFIYAKLFDDKDESDFKSGGPPLFPLYVIDAREMDSKEFALECQRVIFEHRRYIDDLEKDQQKGGGR